MGFEIDPPATSKNSAFELMCSSRVPLITEEHFNVRVSTLIMAYSDLRRLYHTR